MLTYATTSSLTPTSFCEYPPSFCISAEDTKQQDQPQEQQQQEKSSEAAPAPSTASTTAIPDASALEGRKQVRVYVPESSRSDCDWAALFAQAKAGVEAASKAALYVGSDTENNGAVYALLVAPAGEDDAAADAVVAAAKAEVETLFSDPVKRATLTAAALAASATNSSNNGDGAIEQDTKRSRPAGESADNADEPLVELPLGLYAADAKDTRASTFFKRNDDNSANAGGAVGYGQAGAGGYSSMPAGPGYDRPHGNSAVHDNADFIEIPNDKVGMVIGRKGETIHVLQSMTGARITIARECDPGSQMRKVNISGSPDAVAHAKSEINKVIARAALTPSGPDGASAGPLAPAPGSDTVKINVPNQFVGILIGRQGETIRALQVKSSCTVQIQREVRSTEQDFAAYSRIS